MSETMKYTIRKSLKWIWIAVTFAIVCVIGYIGIFNIRQSRLEAEMRAIREEEKEANYVEYEDRKQPIDNYQNNWSEFPEAHRYALYNVQLTQEAIRRADYYSDPLSYQDRYKEIIRRNIYSIEACNEMYNALVKKFSSLLYYYTSEKMVSEMMAMYYVDDTLIVCANAPRSLNLDKDGEKLDEPLYTDKELCKMRDYLWQLLVESIDQSEYIHSLPLRLKRASRDAENTVSESSLLNDKFYIGDDPYEEDGDEENTEENRSRVSIKKIILVFAVGFACVYFVILLVIIGNGKVKTAEELEKTTNLRVFDELTRMEQEKAAEIIKSKLACKNLDDQLVLLTDISSDYEEAKTIAKLLDEQIKVIKWNEVAAALQTMSNQKYLLLVTLDKTLKKDLRIYAKELSQVNARCVGAMLIL